jgi:Tol biopolymer transport system component
MNSKRLTVQKLLASVNTLSPYVLSGSLWTLLAVALFSANSAYATFPGRNGLIAFQSQTDAGFQIFTVDPNGQNLRQITHVSGDAFRPDWSPDGRQIAFEIDRPEFPFCSIALMNADAATSLN